MHVCAQDEIVIDRHVREKLTCLRHQEDSEFGSFMWLQTGDVVPIERYSSRAR